MQAAGPVANLTRVHQFWCYCITQYLERVGFYCFSFPAPIDGCLNFTLKVKIKCKSSGRRKCHLRMLCTHRHHGRYGCDSWGTLLLTQSCLFITVHILSRLTWPWPWTWRWKVSSSLLTQTISFAFHRIRAAAAGCREMDSSTTHIGLVDQSTA